MTPGAAEPPPSATKALRELRRLADPGRAAAVARFFQTGPGQYGEGDRFLGLTVPQVRRLARIFAGLNVAELARLLRSPWHEARLLALLVMVRQYQRGDERTRDVLHRLYLRHRARVNNWDLVDCSAEHLVGAHLPPGRRALLLRLTDSSALWDRRIAILATFHYIKRGQFRDALAVARRLLHDDHDLIHTVVGWMLREVGKRDRPVAERFLARHGARMPRTMLRYAIERYPPRLRRRYLRA